jgi:hypothetical protein
MNASKTKSMTFSLKKNKPDHPILKLSEKPIDEVSCHEHLDVLLSSNICLGKFILKKFTKMLQRP